MSHFSRNAIAGEGPRAKCGRSLAIAVALFALASSAASDEPRDRERTDRGDGPARVTAGQIAAAPGRFFGEEVSVRAEIDSVTSAHVFTLDGDEPGVDPDVLVFVPDPDRAILVTDGPVTVIGTVRRFDWTELSGEYHWLDLTPDLRGASAARPVIVARSVRDSSGEELIAKDESAAR